MALHPADQQISRPQPASAQLPVRMPVSMTAPVSMPACRAAATARHRQPQLSSEMGMGVKERPREGGHDRLEATGTGGW